MAGKTDTETELTALMLRHIASAMRREQERRGMGRIEFAKFCGITAPTYFAILGGTANPTLRMIARISRHADITVHELLHGYTP